ncbi:MAG TPA: hypothetical protein VKX39_19045 [Bryobacteraceae bacterium]|jgi:hypothetical protein|nr:hypothetical protein [Bryobacteraceae bacterium]
MPSHATLSNPKLRTEPAWLWPNLLSIDAPVVALLWQLLFARCFHAAVSAMPAVLLVLAVWLIYAADRLLDVRGASWTRLPRHEFYRRHGAVVTPVWIGVLALAAWLACTRLPAGIFARGAGLAGVVALYFFIVHRLQWSWPKELAVAVLFALGASLTAWEKVRSPGDVATIVLFSCLCWINCAAIEKWERGSAAAWPVGGAAWLVALAAMLLVYAHRPVLSGAEAASALAFVALDHARERLSPDALRVLADAALLSPLLFLPIAGIVL